MGNRFSCWVAATAPSSVGLMGSSIVKARYVYSSRVSAGVFGEAIRMSFELMAFEVHFRLENYEFLLLAFRVETGEVVFSEMFLESVVVDIILLLAAFVSTIAYVASFVLITAVDVQLVVTVEADSTEATFRVAFEA